MSKAKSGSDPANPTAKFSLGHKILAVFVSLCMVLTLNPAAGLVSPSTAYADSSELTVGTGGTYATFADAVAAIGSVRTPTVCMRYINSKAAAA